MKLSRECEIAFDLLIYCAMHPRRTVKSGDGAAFARTTPAYAKRVAHKLITAEFLDGVRGRYGGGIRLTRGSDLIALGDVIRVMEPDLMSSGSSSQALKLQCILTDATKSAFQVLDSYTLADLSGTAGETA